MATPVPYGLADERRGVQGSSTLALVTACFAQYGKCSVYKEVYPEYVIPMHLAQINGRVSLPSGTRWVTLFLRLQHLYFFAFFSSYCLLYFGSKVIFTTCVCIFIYAVDESTLPRECIFYDENVYLLDIIRGLKVNLSVIFKESMFCDNHLLLIASSLSNTLLTIRNHDLVDI